MLPFPPDSRNPWSETLASCLHQHLLPRRAWAQSLADRGEVGKALVTLWVARCVWTGQAGWECPCGHLDTCPGGSEEHGPACPHRHPMKDTHCTDPCSLAPFLSRGSGGAGATFFQDNTNFFYLA